MQGITPLMAVMKRLLYQGRTIHIDETRLQVLNGTQPGKTRNYPICGYMAVGHRDVCRSVLITFCPSSAR